MTHRRYWKSEEGRWVRYSIGFMFFCQWATKHKLAPWHGKKFAFKRPEEIIEKEVKKCSK